MKQKMILFFGAINLEIISIMQHINLEEDFRIFGRKNVIVRKHLKCPYSVSHARKGFKISKESSFSRQSKRDQESHDCILGWFFENVIVLQHPILLLALEKFTKTEYQLHLKKCKGSTTADLHYKKPTSVNQKVPEQLNIDWFLRNVCHIFDD